MNCYVEKFHRDLDLIRIQYSKNKDMDLPDDWKTILENDILFNMLCMFGEDVINYGYDSVSGFEAEYDPDTNDLVNIFVNYFLPMYKTNMYMTKVLEESAAKSANQVIYIGKKDGLVWASVEKKIQESK